jgi:hypothetical protein
MDRKRSIFIVNFLDRIPEKAWEGGKQAWKRQTVTAENVLMGFYSMDPASEPQGRTPSKYCERGQLHFHVFLLTFRCFFSGCDGRSLQ